MRQWRERRRQSRVRCEALRWRREGDGQGIDLGEGIGARGVGAVGSCVVKLGAKDGAGSFAFDGRVAVRGIVEVNAELGKVTLEHIEGTGEDCFWRERHESQ